MAVQFEAYTIVNYNSLEKASLTLHYMTVGADFQIHFCMPLKRGECPDAWFDCRKMTQTSMAHKTLVSSAF